MKAVALWFAPQRMEIEAGDVKIAQRRSLFERIQSPKRPTVEDCRHFWALTFANQVFKSLVAETPNHRSKYNIWSYTCKPLSYRKGASPLPNRLPRGGVSGRRGPSAGRCCRD